MPVTIVSRYPIKSVAMGWIPGIFQFTPVGDGTHILTISSVTDHQGNPLDPFVVAQGLIADLKGSLVQKYQDSDFVLSGDVVTPSQGVTDDALPIATQETDLSYLQNDSSLVEPPNSEA